MDEMALLCNLHADGPATLKVLRRAGLRALPDVCGFDVRKLADTLGVSPAFARRFAREARLLAGRMGSAVLEIEEGEPSAVTDERATPEAEPLRADRAPRADSLARAVHEHTPALQDSIATTRSYELAHEKSHASARVEVAARAVPRAERSSIVPSTGTRLACDLIAGLDRECCDRLVAQGIRTLEELAAAPGLALARRLALPLPRLLDLQYLAQQRLAEPVRAEPLQPSTHDDGEREFLLRPQPRIATALTQTAEQRERTAWRADIGHLQPPLRTPIQADSEVAGPFA